MDDNWYDLNNNLHIVSIIFNEKIAEYSNSRTPVQITVILFVVQHMHNDHDHQCVEQIFHGQHEKQNKKQYYQF